jgi:hypothetical protein
MVKRISLLLGLLCLALWGLQQFDFYSAPAAEAASSALRVTKPSRPPTSPSTEMTSPLPAPKAASKLSSQIDLNPQRTLCELKNQVDIPLTGELRIQTLPLDDGGRVAYVYSSACPRDLYSLVRFSFEGKASVVSDCRKNSITELALQGPMQSTVIDRPPAPGELNLALSGPGLFLAWCNEGFRAVRNGKFLVKEDGMLTTEDGCLVWSRPTEQGATGEPLFLQAGDKEIFFDGCTQGRRCLAILDPNKVTDQGPELIGSQEFALKHFSLDSLFQQLNNNQFTYVFENALEDLNNPDLGLTGAEKIDLWESIPANFNCD